MQKGHSIRKPVAAHLALKRRRRTLALGILFALGIAAVLAMLLVSCGGGSSATMSPPPVASVQPLQIADVQNLLQAAVNSANVDMVVAVVDRAGFVLGRLSHAKRAGDGDRKLRADAGRE